MKIDTVIYGWDLRPIALRRRSGQQGVRSNVPRSRKFLLFADDTGLTLVCGPHFNWPVEYHHQRLLNRFLRRSGSDQRCLGGGVLYTERTRNGAHLARLAFWRHCCYGQYNGELTGLEEELSSALKCRVEVTIE